jgi:hypothetical protein
MANDTAVLIDDGGWASGLVGWNSALLSLVKDLLGGRHNP